MIRREAKRLFAARAEFLKTLDFLGFLGLFLAFLGEFLKFAFLSDNLKRAKSAKRYENER